MKDAKCAGYDDSDDDFLWSEKDIKGKENALKAKQKKAMKAEHDSDQNILEAIMNIKTCIEDISGNWEFESHFPTFCGCKTPFLDLW